jgi:pyrroline-5-carboxylate reductase
MTGAAGPILLVGCGRMGGALLAGWRAKGIAPRDLAVVEPDWASLGRQPAIQGVRAVPTLAELGAIAPSVVVLAVKPQTMESVIGDCRRFVAPSTVFLSIAAGKTIAWFAHHLGEGAAIVRSMPNTPAAVGRGITVAVANARAAPAQKARCAELLAAVGEVLWVEDEALLDPVTAVSGGGPAYVFLLIETLAKAGARAGLPADVATRLARATVCGAGELARLSDEPAETLRRNVTSPGGTTLEALKVLMAEDGIQPLFDRAIAAATRRSRELAD